MIQRNQTFEIWNDQFMNYILQPSLGKEYKQYCIQSCKMAWMRHCELDWSIIARMSCLFINSSPVIISFLPGPVTRKLKIIREGRGSVKKSAVSQSTLTSYMLLVLFLMMTGQLSIMEMKTFPGGLQQNSWSLGLSTNFGWSALLDSCSLATTCLSGSFPCLNIHRDVIL